MRLSILAVVLLVTLPAVSQPLPEEVRKAQELISARDYGAAIEILEPYTSKYPQRLGALNILAGAYEQKGETGKALEAYTKLEQVPRFRASALYGIALIRAGRNENDAALDALQKLRATGSFDMEQLASEPRLAELRKDPRFAGIMPKPSDFEKPFVETVKIIHEIRGDAKGAQFGWIARRVGDVDGDKVADFTTSAPTYAVDGKPAGRVYVYSGRSGRLIWQHTGGAGDQLGIGVEGAGDVNADGVPDVVGGAPGSGFAYVYSGKDGKLLLKLGTGVVADTFGRHASAAGDLNRDRHDDVIIGAPGADNGAGAVFIYSGRDGAMLLKLTGEKAGDAFGSTVAGSSDRRHPFVMVGSPGAGPRGTGRVYVYDGLTAKPKFVVDSDESGGALGGMFLSVVGDTNGDKVPDLYLSDWANSAKGPSTGRVYIHSGADGKQLFVLTGEAAGDGFGIGVSDAGDVDGDGRADLVIGAWQHSSGATSAGKVYLHSGRDGKLLGQFTCRTGGDTFGFDTTNLGDVDGDGTIDFLLTSAWSAVSGFQSGRLFVISSGIQAKKPRGKA